MSKLFLAGAATVVLIAGVVDAQTYPPTTTPPELPAGNASKTTTVTKGPDGRYHATTTGYGVDEYGRTITKKDVIEQGIAGGSTETRTIKKVDPYTGRVTTRATATDGVR